MPPRCRLPVRHEEHAAGQSAVHDDAPGALCVPAAHAVHADAPVWALYVPAAQGSHVTSAAVVAPGAFVPNLPAAQVAVHDVA